MGIKKVFVWLIPICATIALVLYSFGIERVEFDDKYYRFFQGVLQIEDQFKLYIPNIPVIEPIGNGFLDVIVGFLNGLTGVINVLISIFNMAIKVIVFLISILINAINGMRDIFTPTIVASSL